MTDRLDASDAAFLYGEDPVAPSHVGGVVVLAPTDGFDYRRVTGHLASRLADLPRFRQVVRDVPGRLARPVWIDDDRFDLGYHVRRSSLPAPGGAAELNELVGRLISRPLQRGRPLWELYIVEGLAGGRVALINKTHEALVAEFGAVDIAAALLDPTDAAAEADPIPWVPGPGPSDVDLVVDAVADLLARPWEAIAAVRLALAGARTAVGGVLDVGRAVVGAASAMARGIVTPVGRSALDVPVPGPRAFVGADVSLADLKAVRAAHGGTVNDVVLAVVAGALRSWLLAGGDPVAGVDPVRALVPLSVRPDVPGGPAAVTSYLVTLPVAEPNPVVRLHQVSFEMQSHAESGRGVGVDGLLALGRYAPPTLHALGARVARGLSRRSYRMLVTNVPGPQRPLYAAGIPVEAMYPVVPLAKGQAVAVGATSYIGTVHLGVTVDSHATSDPGALGRFLAEAAAELVATVPKRPGRRTGRGR